MNQHQGTALRQGQSISLSTGQVEFATAKIPYAWMLRSNDLDSLADWFQLDQMGAATLEQRNR
jgi:hypothetical protein